MNTNDITIASYPKAGVSYLGWLLTAARAHLNKLPIRPTFFNIDWLLIDSGQMKDKPRPVIWNDGMGDFIKTHDERPPGRYNVIYVLRNPFDTLKSYYHFLRQWGDKRAVTMTPRQFVDDQKFGIHAWLRHMNSWIDCKPSDPVYVVQYENLVADPGGELWNMGWALWGLQFSDETVTEALEVASLQNMRGAEKLFYEYNPGYQKFNMEFVRPGDKREVDGFDQLRPHVESLTSKAYEAVRSKLP